MAQKLYRIGDAAELLGLETHVLRYWETEFSQLRPVRTGKGQRRYTEADMAVLTRIRHLRDQGLTIEGVRRVLAGELALGPNDALPAAPPGAPPDAVSSAPPSVLPSASPNAPGIAPPAAARPESGLAAPGAQKKPSVTPMQLFLHDKTLTDGYAPARPADGDAGHSRTLKRISDELRALLRLLRQN